MKPSPTNEVRKMYDSTASSYAEMMDKEIELPVYSESLARLQERITNVPGVVVDTACGSGHMLSLFHLRLDSDRALLGVDLSPRMVAIANEKLGTAGRVIVGDMSALTGVDSGSAAAVLNYFAVHHLDAARLRMAFEQWCRVLGPGGQLLVAAWEGSGEIDYGDESKIIALRYTAAELSAFSEGAGFSVTRCTVEPVEDFPMDAIYLECVKV